MQTLIQIKERQQRYRLSHRQEIAERDWLYSQRPEVKQKKAERARKYQKLVVKWFGVYCGAMSCLKCGSHGYLYIRFRFNANTQHITLAQQFQHRANNEYISVCCVPLHKGGSLIAQHEGKLRSAIEARWGLSWSAPAELNRFNGL